MKHLFFLLLSTATFAQDIHFKSILVDTHNDCLTACIEKKVSLDQDLTGINHSDLARFKKGGVTNIGPKVTQYTLKPPSGVKLTRITAL
ncbi:MAG: hypothetical protein ACKOUQ_03560, partial [Aquirufa sp.]